MSKLGSWSTTPGSNNATPPDGWPEGQAPSTVNDCAREMMAQIRAAFNDLQYFDPNLTPTFINATSFSVVGDQTSAIHAGRRLKIFDATAGVATTIYATVLTASFTVVTTVSISADGGQLTSSLSSFALAILSQNNNSLPRALQVDTISASSTFQSVYDIFSTNVSSIGVPVILNRSTNGLLQDNIGAALQFNIAGSTSATHVMGRIGAQRTGADSGRLVFQAVSAGVAATNAIIFPSGNVLIGNAGGDSGHQLRVSGAAAVSGGMSVSGAVALAATLSVSGTVVAANVAKAWARFDLLAPPVISSSFNITSISRSATGVVRLNFTTAFVDTSFAWNITYNAARFVQSVSIASGSSFKFTTVDTGGTPTDTVIVNATFYR